MEIFILIVMVVVPVAIRIWAGVLDRDRIQAYFAQRGDKLLESHWYPLGPGWFGTNTDRIYEVRFRDRDLNVHKAIVKTSMFSGVYLTEDRVIQRSANTETTAPDLAAENANLRQRIAELEHTTILRRVEAQHSSPSSDDR